MSAWVNYPVNGLTDGPADGHVRREVLDASRCFHLESPAGSGKTTLLAARYLTLLSGCRPEEVLALTFTRKAAGELRERIVRALVAAQRGEVPASAADAQLAALAGRAVVRHGLAKEKSPLAPNRLQVMTFHSLCASLVENWPLEAGVAPGCSLMDEAEAAAMTWEAMGRLKRSLFRPEKTPPRLRQAVERWLLRLDNRWEVLEGVLSRIISQRDLFDDLLAEVEAGGPDPAAAFEQRLGVLVTIRLRRAAKALRATELGRRWPEFAAEVRSQQCGLATCLPTGLPGEDPAEAGAWSAVAEALLTGGGSPRKSFGPVLGGYFKGFGKTPFAELIKNLPPACCEALALCQGLGVGGERLNTETLADLVALAAEAIGLYEALCDERALLDFVGVEKAALKVLGNDPFPQDGLLAMDARLGHLLVDEFQDTSRNQWLLVQRLCAGFSPEEGRTVFFVGDPKQSIYGFRKAEVALFDEARRGVFTDGGFLPVVVRGLTVNFRSGPELVNWTNRVFERVMADPRLEADEVPFAPAEPAAAAGGEVSLNLFTGSGADAREREARFLAARVREEAARLPAGEKAAVLLFARTHLATYLRALQEAGLAVSVREGLPLAERPEVLGLLALARVLARPHDDLSWVALLRSPWGLVETQVLGETAGLPGRGWQEKLGRCPDPRVAAVHQAVARAQEGLVGRLALAEAVQAVWTDLHGPWEAVCRLGQGSLGNCRAALDLLRQCERATPEETLSTFEERLPEAYQPPLEGLPESAVEMMTVHRAKGLEFHTVFLPQLDWRPVRGRGASPPYLLERLPGGGHVIALSGEGEAGEVFSWQLVKRLAEDRKVGEAKRLFYTAVTRAKRLLVMSATVPLTDGAALRVFGRSPLGWLLEAEGFCSGEVQASDLDGLRVGGLEVRVDAAPEKPVFSPEAAQPSLVAGGSRARFVPEPLAYRKLSASELDAGVDLEARPPSGREFSFEARPRGTIIHRLLERAAHGPLPGKRQVAAALTSAGIFSAARAARMAGEVLSEVAQCLAEPFLASALRSVEREPEVVLEALGEGLPGPERRLDVGIIDLVFRDPKNIWWVVDYKTARPDPAQDPEDFYAAQRREYGPQVAAYRRLVASWKRVAEANVRAALYFTGQRRLIPLD
ncbi:MAG: UvrD-helicase domain-containing protein [Pseudomonadota bacterium]